MRRPNRTNHTARSNIARSFGRVIQRRSRGEVRESDLYSFDASIHRREGNLASGAIFPQLMVRMLLILLIAAINTHPEIAFTGCAVPRLRWVGSLDLTDSQGTPPSGATARLRTHCRGVTMAEATFPIELEGRVIECRTEPDRTMLQEAHSICCDRRSSERHSGARLREISTTCHAYGLGKMGDVIGDLAQHSTR